MSKEALTIPTRRKAPVITSPVTDHKGITYESEAAMCMHYNIPLQRYKNRLRYGWEIGRALEAPVSDYCPKYKRGVKDHKGIAYKNRKVMCAKYGILPSTFDARLRAGMSWEDALTRPVQKRRGEKV